MKNIVRYLEMTVLALCLSVPCFGTAAEAASVALLPLINNVEGDQLANQVYYKEAIKALNAKQGFVLVENDALTAVIDSVGAKTAVPTKEELVKIAKEGKVDIVISMELDRLTSKALLRSRERELKLDMRGKAVAYNALTGAYYEHNIYGDKIIDEALPSRFDWTHEEFGRAVVKEINRALAAK